MRKVKTIKKLPKYTGGGVVDLAEPIPTALNEPEQISKFRMDERKRIYQNYNQQNNSTILKNGIQHTVDDALQKASIGFQLGGPAGAAAGVASSILLGELDNGGHVNVDGSYELLSGITRLLNVGRSDESVRREASRVRTSNIAMQQTANLQANYRNDPRVEVQPPVLAKNGGVISKKIKITNTIPEELVHAKVSKGELYYDPYNKTLSRVPGSPDKPNTDDDVHAFLARGGMIVTNSDEQPLINGKTQAIALAPMVDKPNKNMSKGTIEARDRIIKKATRLNDLFKIENNKTNGVVYANTGNANIGNNENQLLNWLRGKTKGTILGKNLNPPVDGDTRSELEKVRDRMKKWRETGTYFEAADPQQESNQPESNQGGFGHRNLSLTTNGVGGFKPTNKFGYLGPQSTRQLLYEPGDVYYASQFEGWDDFYTKPVVSKSTGAGKSGKATTTASQTPPVRSVKITNTDPEKMAQKQNGFENVIKRYESKQPAFIKPVEKGEEVETTDNKKKFDLSDLYRGLSAIAPLFDSVRPRTTTLNKPTFKPIPVDVDPTNLLQDAQLGYALNNYNTSRGGFTAGQQLAAANVAASNLATQRANIHQWEKEQELKNITQNIMAYNDHSKLLSEIGNTEIDINDRNRAAANTINDTNRKSALNTLGSIAKEMKQEKIDAEDRERKYTMLEPLIKEVYENSDELLPLLKGKIKKVKKTKKSTKTKKV